MEDDSIAFIGHGVANASIGETGLTAQRDSHGDTEMEERDWETHTLVDSENEMDNSYAAPEAISSHEVLPRMDEVTLMCLVENHDLDAMTARTFDLSAYDGAIQDLLEDIDIITTPLSAMMCYYDAEAPENLQKPELKEPLRRLIHAINELLENGRLHPPIPSSMAHKTAHHIVNEAFEDFGEPNEGEVRSTEETERLKLLDRRNQEAIKDGRNTLEHWRKKEDHLFMLSRLAGEVRQRDREQNYSVTDPELWL